MRVLFELESEDGDEILEFEWDSAKAAENRRRHRLSFEEAAAMFRRDVYSIEDRAALGERREISFGMLGDGPGGMRVICVVHTERDHRTRIISARAATPHERKQFHDHFKKTTH